MQCMIQQIQHFTQTQIAHFMDLALEEAHEASRQQQVPVGCVFVNEKGEVVAASHNLTNKFKNASRHCEINCIQQLSSSGIDISKLSLFVTVEPCVMCTYALNIIQIGKVYFGQFNQRFGGCGSVFGVNTFQFVGGIKQKQSLQILQTFYQRGNQRIPQEMRNKSRKRVKNQ